MSGIQGRLNKQFALTIAVSVVISAFNALTLSPALAALLLRPRQAAKGRLAQFFAVFNRWFAKATNGYVGVSHTLIRKSFVAVAILVGFALVDGALGKGLQSSFVPEEDYGYFFLNVQLPPAASLERTDEVCRKIEKILADTEGVQYAATVAGFSLLTRVSASNTAFYFVPLKPWDDRRSAALGARAIVNTLNGRLAKSVPEAVAFGFMPPSIPGLGNSGGFSFWLQDRSGGSVEFLDQNLQAFLAAARKRPELVGVTSLFTASVPQIYANVDQDKALKQGVAVGDVYQTLQTFLGGLYVNQFNRFGRQW
jgi:HAE1 family hydrophobic/amphiphilic exporter-1